MAGVNVTIALAALGQPFKQALQTAASMRVDGIEIDARNDLKPSDMSASAVRQLRKMLDDLNLRITSVRFATRRGYDCTEDLDRRVHGTKQAMRMAVELGCSVLVNSIGQITEPPEDEAARLLMREVLSDLANYSNHYGCFLACETGSEPLATLVSFLETLPEQAIHIALNPANLVAAGYELDGLKSASNHVRVVYANDTVPDRARSGKGMPVPLGQGLVDFPELIATLEDSQFRGPYVVDGRFANDPIVAAKQSLEFLRQL